ncbi:MAG: UDP-N-acetylmuramate--L-alanine ligase [Oscillospiraceae bacterium]|nr:UDP-N-acetylmuramate--L-alanine ligase [Oscillospiraceae bacterium]
MSDLLKNTHNVFLVGIGGVSMCALAGVLKNRGYNISGSDMQESEAVAELRAMGIDVIIGHRAENIGNCDAVIRTAAAKDDNPEIMAARKRGIRVIERAEAWGSIMADYKDALCVSGTHGKTTTTGMAAHIALAANVDPTVMLGGYLPIIGAGHRLGANTLIIAESCEYCNSFLHFLPTISVILNIEPDHLDFFSGLDEIITSFSAFAAKANRVLVNGGDTNALASVANIPHNTFGADEQYDIHCKNLTFDKGLPSFDIWAFGEKYADVKLNVPGMFNVLNALAAAGAARLLDISGKAVTEGLNGFHGTGRRFERLGKYNGADVADDYAHHPTEVKSTLSAANEMGYKRVILAFQPHTYTRTAALFDDFAAALKADKVLITEIYAAREKSTGLSAQSLAEAIPNAGFFPTLDELERELRVIAQEGDLIITMGAGSIGTVGRKLVNS